MVAKVNCPNYRINLLMCPCTNDECDNRGLCCLCMENHIGNEQYPTPACMRGVARPEETMMLPKDTVLQCDRLEANQKNCPCTHETCVRRATCCDCVRNHWTADGTGRTACMREAS